MFKGIVILSVCVVYTMAMFSCMAVVHAALKLFSNEENSQNKAIGFEKQEEATVLMKPKFRQHIKHRYTRQLVIPSRG